jgi:glycosyltransferase involved in cell wall biosynthesis
MSIDLLVLSTACHTAINRKIYKLFDDDGHKTIIVCPKHSYFNNVLLPADSLRKNQDPEIIFDDIDTRNPRLSNFRNLKGIIDECKPRNILIDNDPGSLMVILSKIYSHSINSKIFCISCENLDLTFIKMIRRRGFLSLPNIIVKKFFLCISKFCIDGLFVINKTGLSAFKKIKYNNIIQIPLGYDPAFFYVDPVRRNQYRRRYDINKFAIGFLGRIVKEKGLHILLEALGKITHLDWILVLDEFSHYQNDYSKTIDEMIEGLGINHRIIKIDPTHEDMSRYINMLDLVIIPSISTPNWEEQYGRIAAESIACGTNVAVSKTGHLPDLVSNNGYYFGENNPEELCYIINGFLNETIKGINKEELEKYAFEQLSIFKQKEIMNSAIFGSKR